LGGFSSFEIRKLSGPHFSLFAISEKTGRGPVLRNTTPR
jgi:hypothetical protein